VKRYKLAAGLLKLTSALARALPKKWSLTILNGQVYAYKDDQYWVYLDDPVSRLASVLDESSRAGAPDITHLPDRGAWRRAESLPERR